MTAAQALASIREDIDRLEAKHLVKPGYIRRKRAEADAIAQELAQLDWRIAELEAQQAQHEAQMDAADARSAMLANTITILGHSPAPVLARPPEDADLYYRAARMVSHLRQQAGKRLPAMQRDLLPHALMWAVLSRGLSQIPQLATRNDE